jgi:hypothetical protein
MEPFRAGQKGSSAMPHKRNPILSERIAGMARLLRGYAVTALENQPLWHERDISHSSGRARAAPGRHDPAGLHAGQDARPGRAAGRPAGADAREHRARAGAALQQPRPARAGRGSRACRARRRTLSSSATRCAPPTNAASCATCSPPIRRSPPGSPTRPWPPASTKATSCGTWPPPSPDSISSSQLRKEAASAR